MCVQEKRELERNCNEQVSNWPFILAFPSELIIEIFEYLQLADLAVNCRVSRQWKAIADSPALWRRAIYIELAFGNDKWARFLGPQSVAEESYREEQEDLDPSLVRSEYRAFKTVFPQKKLRDFLLVRVPKTFHSIKNLQIMTHGLFEKDQPAIFTTINRIIEQIGDVPLKKSRWILLTAFVIPETFKKNYSLHPKESPDYDQLKELLAELGHKGLKSYQAPKVMDAIAGILARFFQSQRALFDHFENEKMQCYTICQDTFDDNQYHVLVKGPNRICNHIHLYGEYDYYYTTHMAACKDLNGQEEECLPQ